MSKSDKFQGVSYNFKNRSDDAICTPLSYSKRLSKNVYFMSKSDKFQGFSYNLKNRTDDAICIPLNYSS